MENYFVVFLLPGNTESNNRNDPEYFRKFALHSLKSQTASIVCIRQDTGVSEDLRNHMGGCSAFKRYLLLYMTLTSTEIADTATVLRKATETVEASDYEAVIDEDERFQLVMTDKIDVNGIHVNCVENIA